MLLRRKLPPGLSPPVRGKGLNPVLYYLFYEQLFPYFSPFRVFRYLTFRTAFASITALLICLVLGPWLIARLKEFQIGQYIHVDEHTAHVDRQRAETPGNLAQAAGARAFRPTAQPHARQDEFPERQAGDDARKEEDQAAVAGGEHIAITQNR